MGGKKRKYECVDLDAEKLLYTSFQHAANSIANLYSGSVTAQRKASARASRATLERLLHVLLKDFNGVDAVPKTALFQMLQQEYEVWGCADEGVVLPAKGEQEADMVVRSDTDMMWKLLPPLRHLPLLSLPFRGVPVWAAQEVAVG